MNNINHYKPNQFTSKEKHNLVLITEKYMHLIENKRMDVKSLKEKILAWDLITQEFNSTASENGQRSVVEIKYLFNSLKKAARRVLRQTKPNEIIASSPTLNSVILNRDSYGNSHESNNFIKTSNNIFTENNLRMKGTSSTIFEHSDSPNSQKAIALCESCAADSKSSIKFNTPRKSTTKLQRNTRKKTDLNKTANTQLEILQLRKDIAHFQRDKAFFETQRAILELKEKKMDLRLKEIMLNNKVLL